MNINHIIQGKLVEMLETFEEASYTDEVRYLRNYICPNKPVIQTSNIS